jgi:hypothetical protein
MGPDFGISRSVGLCETVGERSFTYKTKLVME